MVPSAIQPGSLRHKVKIQTATITQTSTGARKSWTTTATKWASIVPMRELMRFDNQMDRAENQYRIIFRGNLAFVPANTRFVCKGKVYHIDRPEDSPYQEGSWTAVRVIYDKEAYDIEEAS